MQWRGKKGRRARRPEQLRGGGGGGAHAARRPLVHARALPVLAAVSLALAVAACAPLGGQAAGPAPAAWLPAPDSFPALLPAAHADPHLRACDPSQALTTAFVSIRFNSPDGVYFAGDNVSIQAYHPTGIHSFSVTYVPHSYVRLETGDIDRNATHAEHRSASPMHVNYTYTVQEGDRSRDLDYLSRLALHWNFEFVSQGATIYSNFFDLGSDYYKCQLPVPGEAGSLSAQGNVSVLGIARPDAYVRAVTPAGEYGAGDTVTVAAEFGGTASYSGPTRRWRSTSAEPRGPPSSGRATTPRRSCSTTRCGTATGRAASATTGRMPCGGR